jgi:hypothetical protein
MGRNMFDLILVQGCALTGKHNGQATTRMIHFVGNFIYFTLFIQAPYFLYYHFVSVLILVSLFILIYSIIFGTFFGYLSFGLM